MYIDLTLITENWLAERDDRTEIEKAKEIISQLKSSNDFLNHLIAKEKDQPEKALLQKEVTANIWEIDRLQKALNKV